MALVIGTKLGMPDAMMVLAEDDAPFSKIAFISRQGQNETLHVIDPVTAKEDTFPFAADSVSRWLPVWSPTCDRILTDENRGDQKVIGIVAYGENGISTDLPDINPLKDILAYVPRWSPDGDSITFEAMNLNDLENNMDIYTFSFSTGELKNITRNPIQNTSPNWSPDGNQIVFTSMSKDTGIGLGYYDIYTVNVDGSSLKTIYDDPKTNDLAPAWSTDGNSIAFTSQDPSGDRILIADKKGSAVTSLTDSTTYNIGSFAWSNDGNYIAFESKNADDDIQIFLLDVNSKSAEPLTAAPKSLNRYASWSPDDTQLVFQSNRDGDFEIYALDVATKAVMQLTHNDYDDIYPAWSPKTCSDTGYVFQGGMFDLNCPTCRVPTATP
ncbi:MAG: hypothetical protein K8I82_08560 [Anaerolineae bacterium]|nr:hypothetical protein [Anaerolineae bacterium]